MRGMIGDTKRALEYRCDAGRGPNIATKPEGFRPAREQHRDLALLRLSQCRPTARSWVAPQRLCATALASALDPLADCALGHTEGLSDAGLGPALLVQFPGPQPAAFAPQQSSAATAVPASFSGPATQTQGLQGKLNGGSR